MNLHSVTAPPPHTHTSFWISWEQPLSPISFPLKQFEGWDFSRMLWSRYSWPVPIPQPASFLVWRGPCCVSVGKQFSWGAKTKAVCTRHLGTKNHWTFRRGAVPLPDVLGLVPNLSWNEISWRGCWLQWTGDHLITYLGSYACWELYCKVKATAPTKGG